MAVSLELENDELAVLFFHLQKSHQYSDDPVIEKVNFKLEALIYSRFSINEIEKYKNKVMNDTIMGEST